MADNNLAPKPENDNEQNYGWQPEVFEGGGQDDGTPQGSLHAVDDTAQQHSNDPERKFGATDDVEQISTHEKPVQESVNGIEKQGARSKNSFYNPLRDKQPLRAKVKSVLKKKKIFGGGLIGLVLGGCFFAFTVIQGPLQFIHASQLLSAFHFSPVEDFGNDRSGKFMLYALSGKSARGRLGANANRRADIWEARLNENGLRSVYQRGTQRGIGYAVEDPVRAKPFLDEMRNRGIATDTVLTGDAVDINDNNISAGTRGVFPETGNFRQMNRVTKGAVRSIGVSRVRGASAARLLIKRTGTNGLFHPFRNAVRRQADSYAAWRQDRKDAERNKYATGDPDLDPANTRLGRLRSRIGTSLRTAKGPAIVVAATCGLKTFSESIDEQNYQNQLSMMRMGAGAMAKGSQVKSMQDFNLDTLGVAAEHFYNESNSTSWLDDPGVQYELGNAPTGHDYLAEKNIKPGSRDKPDVFKVADVVPNVLNVCGLLNSVGEIVSDLPVVSHINSLIDGAARSISGKTPDEWVETARDYFANGAVDTLAEGSEWGGLVNSGARLAANDTMLASGGRELNSAEEVAVETSAQYEQQRQFANSGVFNRYFNVFEARSLTAQLFQHSPKDSRQLATGLVQAPSTFFTSSMALFAGGQTVQAATDYDYGFPLYGFSMEEQLNPEYEDPFENAAFIETGTRLQELNEEYGHECFGMTIGSNGELQYDKALDISEIDKEKCTGSSLRGQEYEEYMRYRFYLADMITVHTLDCYEGLSEDSCRQLGFATSDSGALGSSTTTQGLQSPSNLGDVNSEGYYRMPDALDGEYIFSSLTPLSQRCGTKELVDFTYTVAKRWNEEYGTRLQIGDLNASGHISHRNGIDVDIYGLDGRGTKPMTEHEKAIQLGKWAYDTGLVKEIYYNYGPVQDAVNAHAGSNVFMFSQAGHEDHFHVRLHDQYKGVTSESCAS